MSETYSFTVNGVLRETGEDKPLLCYLRDDLGLHSVKDGCSEGACGACTIVVDGRPMPPPSGRSTPGRRCSASTPPPPWPCRGCWLC